MLVLLDKCTHDLNGITQQVKLGDSVSLAIHFTSGAPKGGTISYHPYYLHFL